LKREQSIVDRIFDFSNITVLLVLAFLFVFPFYIVAINSITAEKFLTAGSMNLWPQEFSNEAYKILFNSNSKVIKAFLISVSSTLVGTVQGLIVITLFAYGMAKDTFPFKTPIMIIVIFTMMFSGGLIPTYMVFQTFGITDSFYVLMIFNAFNAGYMVFIRNFFMSIPKSLPESARLDGANEFSIFLRIMLPLSKPMLACMGLFIAVTIYNDWTTPLFYNSNPNLETLQLLLKHVLTKIEALSVSGSALSSKEVLPTEGIKAATIMIVVIPILTAYPFVQKYFISGVWTGAMKE
jgi:putative aldouronate transport system permease protein